MKSWVTERGFYSIEFVVLDSEIRGLLIFASFFSKDPAQPSQPGPSCDESQTNLKVMVGVKARNGNHGRSCGPAEAGVEATGIRDDSERAPPGGSAEAGAAATLLRDYSERTPPGGSSESGAAATGRREDGEHASPGGSAEAGAAASRVRNDGDRTPLDGSAKAGAPKATATKLLDNDRRGPTSGSAEAGAAATRVLDDGERAPPGGSAKAGAGRLDDRESSAISKELVAKRQCDANLYSGEQGGQLGVGVETSR